MNRTKFVFLLSCMLVVTSMQFTLSAQNLGKEMRIDSILASVNGEGITLLDVMLETSQKEMYLTGIYTGERLQTEIANLRKNTLEEIVRRKLVYEEYKRRPFPIDNQYIERVLDHLALTMGGGSRMTLEEKTRAMGSSMEALRQKAKEKIAVDILLAEFCERPVYITPKAVYEYYAANPQKWTKPRTYSFYLLLIAEKNARTGPNTWPNVLKLVQALRQNPTLKNFLQITRDCSDAPYSDKPSAPVEQDKLRPEFVAPLAKAAPGCIYGPVKTLEGYYFIWMNSITPEQKVPYGKVAEEIRLLLEKEEKEKVRKAYGEKLKAGAIIKYYF